MDSSSSMRTSTPTPPSTFTSPTTGFLLRKRVLAWTQETGMLPSVIVRVDGRVFELHKSTLISKSGYFKKSLVDSVDIELPEKFPGGADIFEMVALFSYDYPLTLDPFNVPALRCAAELLEMTEDHSSSNLRERADLYLNQAVLQSWDDTLIVLQKCQALLELSEELLIVSRCIESLAFMACMEILDPEQTVNQPVLTLQALAGGTWSCEMGKEIAGQNLWIKDLIALPFEFFKRIIDSLRRQGMKEKYVSPIVVFYANKWALSKKTHKFWENTHTSELNGAPDADSKVSMILQGVLELLPMGDRDSRVIPVAFYFALLSRSLTLSLSNDSRMRLEHKVASLLHLSRVEDFLFPESGCESISSSAELITMERIVKIYLLSNNETDCSGYTDLNSNSVVAELWDQYLSQIAMDLKLEPTKFMELIEVVPVADRETHDPLYQAMTTFLLGHPNLSAEEKTAVCKYLDCGKMSQETCIQAVQNEKMPLRLIVQALFVQQLHTQQAFREYSDSFRFIPCGEFSGILPNSRCWQSESQNLGQIPYEKAIDVGKAASIPLGSLLNKGTADQRSEMTKSDYESASFRLQSLEQELMSLKQGLQHQNISKISNTRATKTQSFRLFGMERKATAKKRKPPCRGSSCVGSLSWASHRKYASRLLKVFSRITILGRGKSKVKQAASGPSNGSVTCRSKTLHEVYDYQT